MKLRKMFVCISILCSNITAFAVSIKTIQTVGRLIVTYTPGDNSWYQGQYGQSTISNRIQIGILPPTYSETKTPNPELDLTLFLNRISDNEVQAEYVFTRPTREDKCSINLEFFDNTTWQNYANGEEFALRPSQLGMSQLWQCYKDLFLSGLPDITDYERTKNSLRLSCTSKDGGEKCEHFNEIRGTKEEFTETYKPHKLTWHMDL